VVSDSTPLIALSRINELDVLHKIFSTIMIPNAVYNEVVLQGASRPGARDVMGAAWIIKVPVKNQLTVKTLETDLDRDDGTPL